jgi:hypothetical protein
LKRYLREIVYEERRWYLRKDLELHFRLIEEGGDHLWEVDCVELNLKVYGDNQEEAIERFCEGFAACWDEYAMSADVKLSGFSLEIAHRLRRMVTKMRRTG